MASSSTFPPGLPKVQEFKHLSHAMRGVRGVGPLPYGFFALEDEVDRERVAAVTYIIITNWLAPESEHDPGSERSRFAARVFEVSNPVESLNTDPSDDRYWRVAFVSNYPIDEPVIPRLSSILNDYDFDFEATLGIKSHIQIRQQGSPIRFGVGIVARIEKHKWRQKHEERQRLALIREEKRLEEEMLQAAFSDPTSAIAIPSAPAPPPAQTTMLQRFSVSSSAPPPERPRPSLVTDNFKRPSQRTYHTTIAKRYKAGLLGRAFDWLAGVDTDKV